MNGTLDPRDEPQPGDFASAPLDKLFASWRRQEVPEQAPDAVHLAKFGALTVARAIDDARGNGHSAGDVIQALFTYLKFAAAAVQGMTEDEVDAFRASLADYPETLEPERPTA